MLKSGGQNPTAGYLYLRQATITNVRLMQTVPHGRFIPFDLIIRSLLAELMKHVEMHPSCRHQIGRNISLWLEHCHVYRMKNREGPMPSHTSVPVPWDHIHPVAFISPLSNLDRYARPSCVNLEFGSRRRLLQS
jgi:hypothetical protein